MYYKSKRSVVFFIFFACTFFVGVAQEQNDIAILEYKQLILDGQLAYLPVYPKIIEASVPLDTLSNEEKQPSFYEEMWDNKRFNPYTNTSLSFPVEIKFKDSLFASPVDKKMVVTSRYGWRRGRPHQGIDIDLWVGDNVNSILDGKVRYVGYHGGHGKTVVIRHDNGLESVYAHLSKYLVNINDEVKKGDPIGIGGVTGNARGSHLHLEIRYHGKSINPEYLFEFTNETPDIRSDQLFVTRKWMTPRYHRSTRKSSIVLCTSIEDATSVHITEQQVYRVKKGDTLHRIANKYGLAVSEICKMNAIRYNQVLKIGQEIILVNSP